MGDKNYCLPDDIYQLSNDIIAKRLKEEFKFDCGPVTDTTRNVYLKKLKSLMVEKQQKERNGQADEESHYDFPPVVNAKRSPGRPSIRNSPRPSLGRKAKEIPQQYNDIDNDSDDQLLFNEFRAPNVTKRRQSSQPAKSKTTAKSPTRKSISNPIASASTVSAASTNVKNSLAAYSSESSEDDSDRIEEMNRELRKSPRRKQTPPRPTYDKSSQKVPSARPYQTNRLSMPSPVASLPASSPNARSPLRTTMIHSPPLNLANFSDSESEIEFEQKDSDQNSRNITERLLRHRVTQKQNSIVTQAISTNSLPFNDDEGYSTSSSWISFAILTFVVLFFVFIFSFYFYNRINKKYSIDFSDMEFIDEKAFEAPICADALVKEEACLKYKSDVVPAVKVVKLIKDYIDESITNHYCGEAKHHLENPTIFNVINVKKIIEKRIQVNSNGREIEGNHDFIKSHDFKNALTLIQLNPTWNIHLMDDVYGDADKFVLTEDYQVNLPFTCRVTLTVKNLIWQIIIAIAVVATFWSVYWYMRYKKRLVDEEQDLIYELVEKSLELLQSPDNPQLMPVLHIRDTLLSPSERKTTKYKKIWEKVVKFIETNESRVKVEVENIDGEDFKAWKWVAASPSQQINGEDYDKQSASSPTNVIKTGSIEWQGQAFGENAPSINNGKVAHNFVAPTNFLKIRNMFTRETQRLEPNNWKIKIKNALLQKLITFHNSGNSGNYSGHGIVHIDFDEGSEQGIVYLKCNSTETATNAYHALHGWWCQGELVSVKFLKAERYYNRFPDAQKCSSPLKIQDH